MGTVLLGLVLLLPSKAYVDWFNWTSSPDEAAAGEQFVVSAEAQFSLYDWYSYGWIMLYRNGGHISYSSGMYDARVMDSYATNTAGIVHYEAEAMDDEGSYQYIYHEVSIVTVDRPVPVVTIDGYSSGATVSRPMGRATNITVRFQATDPDNNLNGIKTHVRRPSGTTNDYGGFVNQSEGSGEVARVVSLDENGRWYFWTTARDAANNVEESAWSNVLVNESPNMAPLMAFDHATPTIANGQTFTVSGWAADPENGAPVSRVELHLDERFVANTALNGDRPDVAAAYGRADYRYSGFSHSFTAQGLGIGSHTVLVRAYDSVGAYAQSYKTIAVVPNPNYPVYLQDLGVDHAGIKTNAYGFGPNNNNTYPAYRSINNELWYPWGSVQNTYNDETRLKLQQDGQLNVHLTYKLGSGSSLWGNEMAVYIKDPVTRWVIEVGHEEWYEDPWSYGGSGYYERYVDFYEYFDSESDMLIRRNQLYNMHDFVHSWGETYEWRVIYSQFVAAQNPSQTVTVNIGWDPSWSNKEMIARMWHFQRLASNNRQVDCVTPGKNYIFRTDPAPDNLTMTVLPSSINLGQQFGLQSSVTDSSGNMNSHGFNVRGPSSSASIPDALSWRGSTDAGWSNWNNRGTPSNGSNSTISANHTPNEPGHWEYKADAGDSSGGLAPEVNLTRYVNNVPPAFSINIPDSVPINSNFDLSVTASNPTGLANYQTGLRVVEGRWVTRGEWDGHDYYTYDDIEYNQISSQPLAPGNQSVSLTRYASNDDYGEIYYEFYAWNQWMNQWQHYQTRTVQVYNRPPTVSMTINGVTSDGGQTSSLGVPNDASLSISFSGSDPDNHYWRTRLWVRINSGSWQQIAVSTAATHVMTYTLSTIGTYEFQCRSQDGNGLESSDAVINVTNQNRNPTITIEIDNTGDITSDMAIGVKAIVTPPADYPNYVGGMRILKWVGSIGQNLDINGPENWSTIYEKTDDSPGVIIWHDPAQPAAGSVCKIVYRVYAWQEGGNEWSNYTDGTIIIQNSGPNHASIVLNGTQIEYGQTVTVTGTLKDPDGNLMGHSLWVVAPLADGTKNTEWDPYSRALNPNWWGYPDKISEAGWSGAWNDGRPSNGATSVVAGVFKPSRLGVWQLHTNGCDSSEAWGPGDTKDLTVVKATPECVFNTKVMAGYETITSSHLNAVFRNSHDQTITPGGAITYTLDGAPVSMGQNVSAGSHTLCANYAGDTYHLAASATTTLTVIDNPNDDDDGDYVPNGIEARLGTSPSTPGVMDTTNALEIKILTPISTED